MNTCKYIYVYIITYTKYTFDEFTHEKRKLENILSEILIKLNAYSHKKKIKVCRNSFSF